MTPSREATRKRGPRTGWLLVVLGLVAGPAWGQLGIPRDTHTHVAASAGAHVTARQGIGSSEFVRVEQDGDEVPLEVPEGTALVVTDVHCEVSTRVIGPRALRVYLGARLASGARSALFTMRLPLDEGREASAAVALTSGFVVPAQASLEAETDFPDDSASECFVYGYLVPTGPVQIPLPDLTLPRPDVPPGGGPGVPPPTTEPPF